jgi:hypothetical protein
VIRMSLQDVRKEMWIEIARSISGHTIPVFERRAHETHPDGFQHSAILPRVVKLALNVKPRAGWDIGVPVDQPSIGLVPSCSTFTYV